MADLMVRFSKMYQVVLPMVQEQDWSPVLSAGSYTYNVTDANGCTASCSVTITEPSTLVATCSFPTQLVMAVFQTVLSGSRWYLPLYWNRSIHRSCCRFFILLQCIWREWVAQHPVQWLSLEPAAIWLQHVQLFPKRSFCNGGSEDGSVSVSASGGTAPIYWNRSFTGLAGSYTYKCIWREWLHSILFSDYHWAGYSGCYCSVVSKL